MGIRMRVAGLNDQFSIGLLMEELMPHADTAPRQEWLYRSNPDGAAITVLATDEDSGELAGMTSAFPRRMLVHGQVVLGALGGDGWVRPQFRRRGIGSLMHLASRAALAARGIEMLFGTPSAANATALGMAGGRDVTSLRRWVRPLLAGRLGVGGFFQRIGRFRSPARLIAAAPGDADLDVAWADLGGEARIATVRDSEFLRWRFQEAPSATQSLWIVRDDAGVLGACALEVLERRVRVVDLISRRDRFPRVLNAIFAAHEDAEALEVRLDDTPARALGLWRRGFFPRERVPLNVMLSSAADWAGSAFASGEDWFSTRADTDVDTSWRAAASRQHVREDRVLQARG